MSASSCSAFCAPPIPRCEGEHNLHSACFNFIFNTHFDLFNYCRIFTQWDFKTSFFFFSGFSAADPFGGLGFGTNIWDKYMEAYLQFYLSAKRCKTEVCRLKSCHFTEITGTRGEQMLTPQWHSTKKVPRRTVAFKPAVKRSVQESKMDEAPKLRFFQGRNPLKKYGIVWNNFTGSIYPISYLLFINLEQKMPI